MLDFKRSGRIALAIASSMLLLWLSGCATTVDSQFTVYHAWPAEAVQRSYRFAPAPQREDSLEQAAFQSLARPELAQAGFVESPDGRFGVTLTFRDDRVVRRVLEPYGFGPWYGWDGWPGPWYGGWYGGWYGWNMMAPMAWPTVRNEVIHRRSLSLQITDLQAAPPKRVYETTSVSEDFDDDPSKVLPVMLRQILKDFPGRSGQTHRASTPLP